MGRSCLVSLTPMLINQHVFTLLVSLLCAPSLVSAQRTVAPNGAIYHPNLTFDLISVRQCPPGPQSNGMNNPAHSGRFMGTCVWADELIGWAYDVDYRTQVVGGPDWVKTSRSNEVRFEIKAQSDGATEDRLARLNDENSKLEKQHMLQSLLATRFGLRAHIELKQEPALALMVGKHGPKLQRGDPPPPKPENSRGPWPAPIESHRDPRGIALVAYGASIGGSSTRDLAGWLQFYLGKRVIDQTGIVGTFNFTLQFAGMRSSMQRDEASMWPPLETAIKDELGLKVKETTAPLRVVVIDHIDLPSPN